MKLKTSFGFFNLNPSQPNSTMLSFTISYSYVGVKKVKDKILCQCVYALYFAQNSTKWIGLY